jgi:hypothetical protein
MSGVNAVALLDELFMHCHSSLWYLFMHCHY